MSRMGLVALGINTGMVQEASADQKKELPACVLAFSYSLLFNYICRFQGISRNFSKAYGDLTEHLEHGKSLHK